MGFIGVVREQTGWQASGDKGDRPMSHLWQQALLHVLNEFEWQRWQNLELVFSTRNFQAPAAAREAETSARDLWDVHDNYHMT